jgi:hypothetical protein
MSFKYSEYQKTLNSYIDYSILGLKYTATSFGSVVGNWFGSVLAPNGNIYGIPASYTSVLEINPISRTANTFGNVGTNYTSSFPFLKNWAGGVLAPNGKIYGIPSSATTILEIDPVAGIATTFGSVSSGSDKWVGGVLGYDGMIYGIPYNSTTVLQINPITRTATTFGSITSGNKWWNGVIGPNGIIYGSPYTFNSNSILKIIPDSVSPSVSEINVGTMYASSGAVLGPDGRIYYMPGQSSSSSIFDPRTETLANSISGPVVRNEIGGVLASNNKIYSSYATSGLQILEIDVMAQTSVSVNCTGTGSWPINTAVLASNGKIYGVNNGSLGSGPPTCVCSEIDVGCASAPADWVLSAYQNKF